MTVQQSTPDAESVAPVPVTKKRTRSRTVVEWALVVVVAVLVSFLVRTYVFQTFYIPSGSMEPTLLIGDRIVVNKLAVEFGTIHTGDIVVFKAPAAVAKECNDNVTDLVKRVIGLPGQHLVSKGNTIYVNGKPLAQPWTHNEPLGGVPITSTVVPKNHYFMMGDNEADSCDSRYWGTVPRSSIIGKVFLRVWPLSHLDFL